MEFYFNFESEDALVTATEDTQALFDSIKHTNEYGQEFWYARELQTALEYKRWDKFLNVIEKAKDACMNSKNSVSDHFSQVGKMVNVGSGAEREIEDYELSRYACYLIVQNGDPRKKVIALGQSYFAVKTRQQELIEDFDELSENQKRIAIRNELKNHNKSLAEAAHNAGVKTPLEYAVVGKKVRQTISDLGGTMPEHLPTPEKSVRQLENESKKRQQNNLFPE